MCTFYPSMPKYPKGAKASAAAGSGGGGGDDSGTPPQEEEEEEQEQEKKVVLFSVLGITYAACAGLVEEAIKRLPGIQVAVVDVLNNRVQVIFYPAFVSVRSKLSTLGGNALKFYASVRMNIERIGLVKKGEETVWSQVLAKIVKNKHAPPFKTAQLDLEFGKGISRDSEIIELGCKDTFIKKGDGAFYSLNGHIASMEKMPLNAIFQENEGAREELMMKLKEKLLHETEKKHELEIRVPDGDLAEEIVTSDTMDAEVSRAVEA